MNDKIQQKSELKTLINLSIFTSITPLMLTILKYYIHSDVTMFTLNGN